jgi:hypothetical protein
LNRLRSDKTHLEADLSHLEQQLPPLTNIIDRDLCNLEIACLRAAIRLNVTQTDLIAFKKENFPGQKERSVNDSKPIKNGDFTKTRYFSYTVISL